MAKKANAKTEREDKASYLEHLDPKGMTGAWEPVGEWKRLHGDCKSSAGGKYHIQTMQTSSGKFKVKVMENGRSLRELDFNELPSFQKIVKDVKDALAPKCKQAPACGRPPNNG